jgi:hypothetical protein
LATSRWSPAADGRRECSTNWARPRSSGPASTLRPGLDIGARSAGEIALSICAGIVSSRPRLARRAVAEAVRAAVAVDPICGMEVAVSPASLHVGDVYFCGAGCMASWPEERI